MVSRVAFKQDFFNTIYPFRDKERPLKYRPPHVYEIDHPATQQWKRTRISELEIPLPTNLRFVPLDFERQTVTEALRSSDYRTNAPAVFSWLGVTCT
jgi:O-methyltransferase involved in polyketide biosynthesis